ncbi:MAG: hypothetical protein ACP5SI_11835 [Chloroflexia bacterium]
MTLLWAGRGPGWEISTRGATWYQARYWRLPTVDEAVCSLVRSGGNAGCTWSGRPGHVARRVHPDKETPLWAPDAPVIYYWTDTEANPRSAHYVSFSGGVYAADKPAKRGSLWFRCVRES